jgi:hypothetical protein
MTEDEKLANRELSREWIVVENTLPGFKRFQALADTPVGMRVRAEAEHRRAIIDLERFKERVEAKSTPDADAPG